MIVNLDDVFMDISSGEPIKYPIPQAELERIALEARAALSNLKEITEDLYQVEFAKRVKSAQRNLTLKDVCIMALIEPSADSMESIKRYSIALKMSDKSEIDLSINDIKFIFDAICHKWVFIENVDGKDIRRQAPLIVGQAAAMLGIEDLG